jgi:hemoglobin
MPSKIKQALALCCLILAAGVAPADQSAVAEEVPTLYARLGSWDGIHQIVKDTIANHERNPAIAHYFNEVDKDKLAGHVTAFFAAGTGGPNKYEGRDMTTTHATMGLSNDDFDKAVADVLLALDQNDIGEAEKTEVAAILESLRPAVMGTTG